jgi:hypothetical protein
MGTATGAVGVDEAVSAIIGTFGFPISIVPVVVIYHAGHNFFLDRGSTGRRPNLFGQKQGLKLVFSKGTSVD